MMKRTYDRAMGTARERVLDEVRDLAPRDAEQVLRDCLEQVTEAREEYERSLS